MLAAVKLLGKDCDGLWRPSRAIYRPVNADVQRLLLNDVGDVEGKQEDAIDSGAHIYSRAVAFRRNGSFLRNQEGINHGESIVIAKSKRCQSRGDPSCTGAAVSLEPVHKLPEQWANLLRLFPSGIVSGMGNDLHLTASDVLSQHFGLGHAGSGIFITRDDQGRNIDRLERLNRIGTLGHPALHHSDILWGHFAHHAERTFDEIRTGAARGFGEDFWDHTFEKGFGATLKYVVCGLKATSFCRVVVGSSLGVAERQSGNAAAITPPELEECIATDRDADKNCSAQIFFIENAGDIGGMLCHGRGSFADVGIAVSAEIRQDEAITVHERARGRVPELMVNRKRMEQYNGVAISEDFVGDFGVVVADALHGS